MKYSKPVVISSSEVTRAKCGSGGPCGRPCDGKPNNSK